MRISSRHTLLILLALVMTLAAYHRLLLVERVLPEIDLGDEATMFRMVMMTRPNPPEIASAYASDVESYRVIGHPPVVLWAGALLHHAVESWHLFPVPPDYVYANRLVMAALGVVTAGLLATFGWQVGRPAGVWPAAIIGGLAGLTWAVRPRLVEINNLAMLDAWYYPVVVLALIAALQAYRTHKPAWLALAVAACIVGIYIKYTMVVMLWLPAWAYIAQLRANGLRRMLPWTAGLGVAGALTAGYLLFGVGALSMENQEAQLFYGEAGQRWLDLSLLWLHLDTTVYHALGVWTFYGVLAAGVIAYAVAWRRGLPRVPLDWLWLAVPFVVFNQMLVATVKTIPREAWPQMRNLMTIAMVLLVVWAVAVAQSTLLLRATGPRVRRGAALLPLALAVFVLVPAWQENHRLRAAFAVPTVYQRVWDWADSTLPNTGAFMMDTASTHADILWQRSFSGYPNEIPFAWVMISEPDKTPAAYYEAGVEYLVRTQEDYAAETEQAFLAQLTPIKHFDPLPGSIDAYEHALTFYRLLPPQAALDVSFGAAIRLVGYDLSAAEVAPGETLTVRFYWRATTTPADNVNLFVHLYPADDPTIIVAQFDGTPTRNRPTLAWDDPDELIIGRDVSLALTPDLPPGDYTLGAGLYNYETGARLATASGDRVEIPLAVRPGDS